MNICITVVAFNKVKSLSRLLMSLNNIVIPSNLNVDLSFCIDGGGDEEVIKLAKEFLWHGTDKSISVKNTNLGLKKNIYAAMKSGLGYDAIIILEDDLFVSPQLLKYVGSILDNSELTESVAGYSLYAPNFNETAYCSFKPISDNNDIYFMKVPSSWGQFYTKTQLAEYFNWYDSNTQIDETFLPPNVARWSDRSWKKEFFAYLIYTNKYFVYPKCSLTTNYADAGEHHKGSDIYQVPLLMELSELQFANQTNQVAVYDEYYEIEAVCINRQVDELKNYDYTVDLYGYKKLIKNNEYILSTVKQGNPVMTWDNSLIPLEMNVIYGVKGTGVYLYKASEVGTKRLNKVRARIQNFMKLHQIRIDKSLISRLLGRS
jgi:hypothetical protein